MKENSIRRAVREGRAALGTGLKEFASRGVPWIIEASGFDYCMIDHEHGAFDLETIADLAGWFQATDVSAIVRIHKSFTYLIPAILDQGIMGVQVSEVDNAEEARAIAREAKYPPIGNRAGGVVRAVEQDQRSGPHHLEPARRGHPAKPSCTAHSVEWRADVRLRGRERERGVVDLVRAVQRDEHLRVLGLRRVQVDEVATVGQAVRRAPRNRGRVARSAADRVPRRSRPAPDRSRPARAWRGRRMIPALSAAISARVEPRNAWVVEPDVRDDRDVGVDHVGRVPVPPIPTSITPTWTATSAKNVNAAAIMISK